MLFGYGIFYYCMMFLLQNIIFGTTPSFKQDEVNLNTISILSFDDEVRTLQFLSNMYDVIIAWSQRVFRLRLHRSDRSMWSRQRQWGT